MNTVSAAEKSASVFDEFVEDLTFGHKALRRNLKTIIDVALAGGAPPAAFFEFVGVYRTFLLAHHQGEDDVLFPALRKHAKSAADVAFVEARAEEHKTVHGLLEEIEDAVRGASSDVGEALARIGSLCQKLQRDLLPHLDAEEANLTPDRLEAWLSLQEMEKTLQRIAATIGRQGPSVSMFLFHSFTFQEQEHLRQNLPWFFRSLLIDGLWRHKNDRFSCFAYEPADSK
jgi:hemerythrin-like domain-containing protein